MDTIDQHDVELRPTSASATATGDALSQELDAASHPGFTLPRADGGREAWLVLASCFVLEATVWGRYTLALNTPYHHR